MCSWNMAMYHKSVSEINTLVIQYPAWKKKKKRTYMLLRRDEKLQQVTLCFYIICTELYIICTELCI